MSSNNLRQVRRQARLLSNRLRNMGLCEDVRLVHREGDEIWLRFKNVPEEVRVKLGHELIAMGLTDVEFDPPADLVANPMGMTIRKQAEKN